MRQAAESEIIRLSMDIREQKPIQFFKGNEVQVLNQSDLSVGMMQWADQILCGTNATRLTLNAQMRQALGFEGPPQDGDKIICLRNYWEEFDDNENALVNGTIGTLKNSFELENSLPYYIHQNVPKIAVIHGAFETEFGTVFDSLEMDKNMFDTGSTTLDWKTSYSLGRNTRTRHLVPKEYTYGYCITCHKAQGSEWEKVLVVEESFPFATEEHARWLYTAITRSVEKCVLVR